MKHFCISIAGLVVEITARYPMIGAICEPYLCKNTPFTDFSVYVTPAQLSEKIRSFSVPLTEEEAECICVSDAIALKLLRFDAFLLHAAVLDADGTVFGIVAPRGIGKTTHAHLWRERYGNRLKIINGDKPIVRRMPDGRFYAFGTPFCGKEREGINTGAPLDALVLLSRGSVDRLLPVDDRSYLDGILRQTVFPADRRSMERGARLLAQFMRSVPAIAVECTPTAVAVDTVALGLKKIKK